MTFGNISLANRTWMYIISEFLYMFPHFLLKYKQKFQKLGKMINIVKPKSSPKSKSKIQV